MLSMSPESMSPESLTQQDETLSSEHVHALARQSLVQAGELLSALYV